MDDGMSISKEQLEIEKSVGNFNIEPYSGQIAVDQDCVKLDLDKDDKRAVSAFMQYLPSLIATTTLSQSYIVSFPEGLPHVLTSLQQGGFGTTIQDHGRFVGTASLYPTTPQAVALGVFTVMSIASSQYFLNQINNELKMMKLNIDKILEFLYGDKKAELMAEVSFVKYAYQNFSSIMKFDVQRIATIGSLQSAKKVAMKDIEFYMSDLESTANSKGSGDIVSLVNRAFQIKESLELSMQLYGMSSILETYYAQNRELVYLEHIEAEVISYIDKCEKRMLSSFSILGKRISDYSGKLWNKIDKSSYEKIVGELVYSLNSGAESTLRKTFRVALQNTTRSTKYYLTKNGDVYLKMS